MDDSAGRLAGGSAREIAEGTESAEKIRKANFFIINSILSMPFATLACRVCGSLRRCDNCKEGCTQMLEPGWRNRMGYYRMVVRAHEWFTRQKVSLLDVRLLGKASLRLLYRSSIS